MNTIFIQIASYRDPQLIPTIEDCLAKAKHPENLKFCIAWQHDETENLDKYKNNPQFKILDIPYQQGRGACWARHQINNEYQNEKFTLQIDSHMRFIENWDEELINIWSELKDDKAILTTYPAEYYPDKPREQWKQAPHVIHTYAFKNSFTQQRPRTPTKWQERTTPYKAIHVAAGFIFGLGKFIKDVPYDPEFYFEGEETGLAIRLYTHGYNLYHPHKLVLWHYYGRKDQPKHWSDHTKWGDLQIVAKERLNCLLQRNQKFYLGKYGLGTVRTLEDFQNYSGIDYKRCVLHLDTKDGKEPPVDLSDSYKWSYQTKTFEQTLTWNYDELDKCEDPRFWAFIIKDQNNHELFREDVRFKDEPDVINGVVRERTFKFDYYFPAQVPTIFMVWPYSESKKWLKNKTWTITLKNTN